MFEDIIWIEGLRDYIKVNLKSTKKPLIVRTSLKAIESEFHMLSVVCDYGFFHTVFSATII